MKRIFILAATATLLFSCKKTDEKKGGIYNGTEVAVQHGKGWTWVKVDANNAPEQMAITINDAALNSMPVGGGHGDGGHTHDNVVMLPLAPQAKATTPFDHIELDWNPEGHPPMNIYTLPHFDFHYYMVTEAEVRGATDTAKLNAAPGAQYLPANHISGGAVPQMGNHWVDVTSPEFNGQAFTQSFLYGTYNSKITFYEPMITLNFLKTTTRFTRSIPQPARFKTAGYYPTKMTISKHDGVTDVILEGFVKRNAS